jgi:hypothetical protein
MSKRLRFHRDGEDDGLTTLLRSAYAAPDDPAYWDGLEARIGRTLREADGGSAYRDLLPVMRLVVGAAAALALAAGVLEYRAHAAAEQVALKNVLNSSQPAARAALEKDEQPAREETLRYLMTNY